MVPLFLSMSHWPKFNHMAAPCCNEVSSLVAMCVVKYSGNDSTKYGGNTSYWTTASLPYPKIMARRSYEIPNNASYDILIFGI